MDRTYWSRLASSFGDEVMEIANEDLNGTLKETIGALSDPGGVAIDFGCGTGSSTRAIAPHFARTIGIDFSDELLDVAKRQTQDSNIEYRCRDLAKPTRVKPAAHVAFAINVLIHPNFELRHQILRNVVRNTAADGQIVIVVPAFESFLHIHSTLLALSRSDGKLTRSTVRAVDHAANEELISLSDGLVKVGGEPTKLHTFEQLNVVAETHGLNISTISKIHYPWTEELADIEDSKLPESPWDWLMVARPRGGRGRSRTHQPL